MSEYIHKSHNVSVLLYHLVCPTKYRRAVLDAQADQVLRAICLDIERRYEITFLQIGVDQDHAHFLIQSVPTFSPSRLAQKIKSLTAREMFRRLPELKNQLWGGALWTSGYVINTVIPSGITAASKRFAPMSKSKGKRPKSTRTCTPGNSLSSDSSDSSDSSEQRYRH